MTVTLAEINDLLTLRLSGCGNASVHSVNTSHFGVRGGDSGAGANVMGQGLPLLLLWH
jgi:hypothetical protein